MKRILLSLLLMSHLASAGNGSSGGGNIFGDQLNPWFFTNTPQARICILVSPNFSSLPRETIVRYVESSLELWRSSIQKRKLNQDWAADYKIGPKMFVLDEECSTDTDLRFQFGELTPSQKEQIPNYRQLLGIAYRSSYDEVNLRAKGFIYIAPEQGADRPNGEGLPEKIWSEGNGSRLKFALAHEVGHIFGLQDDYYSTGGVMGATFVETIAQQSSIIQFIPKSVTEAVSDCGLGSESSIQFSSSEDRPFTGLFKTFFGLGNTSRVDFQQGQKEIIVSQKINEEMVEVGRIDLTAFTWQPSIMPFSPLASVWLTPNQRVFKAPPENFYGLHHQLIAKLEEATKYNVTYRSPVTGERKLNVSFRSRGRNGCIMTFWGVVEGKLVLDLTRASP